MKKISLALAAMMMAVLFVFAGCGEETTSSTVSNANTSTTSGEATADNSLQKVLDAGVLKMGLDDSFPPMGFRNENSEIIGFDLDLAAEVAKRMGVTLEPTVVDWNSNIMELDSGNVDCLWNGFSIDTERMEKTNLSKPYMKNRMVFVVLGNSSYTDQASLEGKKVGVQNGSTAQRILEENKDFTDKLANVADYKENVTAFMVLESGTIDALFVDEVVANYILNQKEEGKLRILDDSPYTEEYAIAFKKQGSDALKNKVEEILLQMKNDGTMAEISTRWFGEDVTTFA